MCYVHLMTFPGDVLKSPAPKAQGVYESREIRTAN